MDWLLLILFFLMGPAIYFGLRKLRMHVLLCVLLSALLLAIIWIVIPMWIAGVKYPFFPLSFWLAFAVGFITAGITALVQREGKRPE